MNIIIPNYEILNFDTENLVVSDVGISRIDSQPMIEVLRRLTLSKVMTKEELDEVLMEHGIGGNEAFEFLEAIIPLRFVDQIYFEKNGSCT